MSDDLRADVKAMCAIIADDSATADEQRASLYTLIDLMAPELLDTPEAQEWIAASKAD